MPIPLLDENGFLPAGVHDCTFAEVKSIFGAFQGSDRRPALLKKLEGFVFEALNAKLFIALLVDGSFVTAKRDPNDIDLVAVLPSDHDFRADLDPTQYALIAKRQVQRRFGFDIVAVRERTVEYDQAVEFFSRVRGWPRLRKGILRLTL